MLSTRSFHVFMPSSAQSLYNLSIAVCVISTLVTCLRFWSHSLLPMRRFQVDDWTALLAWPFVIGAAACNAIDMRHGFGVHITEIIEADPTALPIVLKLIYAGQLIWVVGMGIIRCSALLFYNRIFSHSGSRFRRLVIMGVIANILWTVVLSFVLVFQCTPINAYWDTVATGRCLAMAHTELGSGVSSIILDLQALILPVPIIWKLQLCVVEKMLSFIAVALGYCVIVATVGRIITIVKYEDPIAQDLTWSFTEHLYWIIIELAAAYICISLPSVFALCRRARWRGLSSLFTMENTGITVNVEVHAQSEDESGSRNSG